MSLYCPVCGSLSVERAGDTYGKCGQCNARVYMAPDPMREAKAALIAQLLREAKAARESTMEVSPETNEDE
jgi:uncharacterized Zn finger protein (UPF0148 family)